MKRLERLHALSERLRAASPETVSARRLAEEFEVSRRTIERDLDSLRRAGAALWGQPGRAGGVGILDGPKRLISLSDAEIAGLAIAVHAVGDAPFVAHAKRAVDILVDHAGDEAAVSIEQIRQRVVLADVERRASPDVRHTLESAILDQRQVSMRYRDRQDAVTRRRVDPIGFLGNGTTWSLIGFCHLRNDGRLFRLERIVKVSATVVDSANRDPQDVLGFVPFPTRRLD